MDRNSLNTPILSDLRPKLLTFNFFNDILNHSDLCFLVIKTGEVTGICDGKKWKGKQQAAYATAGKYIAVVRHSRHGIQIHGGNIKLVYIYVGPGPRHRSIHFILSR